MKLASSMTNISRLSICPTLYHHSQLLLLSAELRATTDFTFPSQFYFVLLLLSFSFQQLGMVSISCRPKDFHKLTHFYCHFHIYGFFVDYLRKSEIKTTYLHNEGVNNDFIYRRAEGDIEEAFSV